MDETNELFDQFEAPDLPDIDRQDPPSSMVKRSIRLGCVRLVLASGIETKTAAEIVNSAEILFSFIVGNNVDRKTLSHEEKLDDKPSSM